ncbi:ABC transporter permease [Zobellia galactanivorans]|uniref:ABC importer, permease component n=1 Tax=Zobellia galactanivorans (strain DSM 12802 / CCUG 47099 / CIP 106680 / NCIMB 13871 / Dsij) TaxID=63186 RepID=G0L2B1_ZOBGA|nr:MULTISPECIES: ABC transporter permease [Zobellia]MBU3024522.1 ABC transporter permease [Zobellia galactanivorans]MDO6518165.1 ABC transporter permease [Zobellia uliginosa]MDO6807626.1 ABC transporter permease [Zobellia galactanivorans]OWW25437.1 ABC transporter permease [Zobellia sp. OII3]CAZ98021.1 ABC importer, permease component [Zobellia galactanivorans]
MNFKTPKKIRQWLIEIGELSYFAARFFKEALRPPYEFNEFLRQCYQIGYRSLTLVLVTGFIIGLVMDLQSRPTMIQFGAVSWMPNMVGISIVRELGPVITALVCAGRISSGIGAELGSMRVTEQIDAMEVSGTNPFKFLVVTRVMASIMMLPLLVVVSDAVALFGSALVENIEGNVSFQLYFNTVFDVLTYTDIIPATIKTFFFGFAIGIVGCYKGFYSKKGTAGVGIAANTAVVMASLLLFVIDFVAVFISNIFYDV